MVEPIHQDNLIEMRHYKIEVAQTVHGFRIS